VAREIREFSETWLDRAFEKGLKKLGQREKEALSEKLASLLGILAECRHPITDPGLSAFRPTPYRVSLRNPEARLAEYRLGDRCRVIAAYFHNHDEILLVAITLDHDHTRLKVLVERFGASSSLPDPKKETESDDSGSS
jgi:mRNA-degrading endonuclease RelE of RelBE toxin-antitoxin system